MDLRPNLLRGAALCLSTILLSIPVSAVDLYGVDAVRLHWDDASGPVAGYFVIVTPADEGAFVHGVVSVPEATLSARPGDAFSVMVAAFDKQGVAGPLSATSEMLRFHRDAGGTGPPDGGGDPPPDDGGGPPPDDGDPGPKGPGTPYDFDGDGVSDLLVREPNGGVAIWRMDGSAVLAADPIAEPLPASEVIGSGDYDGDGIADLLWEEIATGSLRVSLLRNGAVVTGAPLDLGDLASSEAWRVGGSGDFDADGHDDVLLFSRVVGESEILYMRDGSLDSRLRLPGYVGAWSVDATDDVDGDGVDEVVWRDEARHELVLWDVNGAGVDTPGLLAGQLTGWRVVGSGDFDGDRRADLFAEHAAQGLAQVWIQDGTAIVAVVDLPTPAAGLIATHVGDYDFDGLADLVWSDSLGGNIEIWFSDGDGVTAESVTGGGDGALLLGEEGSDDSEFRARLCDADFDDDGGVDATDFPLFIACFGSPGTGDCQRADMDSDGVVGHRDFALFRAAFLGTPCGR